MHALLAISRGIDRINEVIGKSVIWLILIAVLVSSINALVRKIFNVSSNAWLELQWYLYGGAFLLAAAATLKQGEHVRIDILYGVWSRRIQHRIDLFGHLVFLLPFVLLLTYYLWPYAMRSLCIGQNEFCRIEMSPNSGGLPLWPVKFLLLFSFIQMSAQAFSEIIKKIAVICGVIEDPNPFVSAQEAAEAETEALVREIQK